MIDFIGKNILITGGSRGIGRATALAFAKAGANVAFTYRRNDDAAKEVRSLIESLGVKAMAQKAEAQDEGAMKSFMARIAATWGSLDVAVANAGIWTEASIDKMTAEQFRETMDINMTGSFLLVKYASAQMKGKQSGSIVLISSTSGQRGEANYSHYSASKGAQISFTKSLALELAPFGIRVNCVAPGWTESDMTRKAIAELGDKIGSVIPLGRAGKPEEIADAILYLASPMASFITGEILNVNGGAVLCG
jgi:3-oxoacyl-[acyl-carrier protein] reductase